MLKIRLTRKGKKNNAFYRLVVAEHTSPIKGRFIEALGHLNPHTKERNFKQDRIKYWIEKGAQCSDTVHNLLVGAEILKGSKRAIRLKKKPQEESKENAEDKSKEEKPAEGETKPTEETAESEEKKEGTAAIAEAESQQKAEVPKERQEEVKEKKKIEDKSEENSEKKLAEPKKDSAKKAENSTETDKKETK